MSFSDGDRFLGNFLFSFLQEKKHYLKLHVLMWGKKTVKIFFFFNCMETFAIFFAICIKVASECHINHQCCTQMLFQRKLFSVWAPGNWPETPTYLWRSKKLFTLTHKKEKKKKKNYLKKYAHFLSQKTLMSP